MGLIQSILCSCTFCIERVLTWTCCAFLLMLLMFTIMVLMMYGISVGYHYAQRELSRIAFQSRQTTLPPILLRYGKELPQVVRLLAVNRSEVEQPPRPLLELYRRSGPKENVYIEKTESAVELLQTEKPPVSPDLALHEKEVAKYLIGRFRRSRNLTNPPTYTTPTTFYRTLADRLLTNISLV